jgi:hypothetical protein
MTPAAEPIDAVPILYGESNAELRVTDREISAGCTPARTSQRTSTYGRT